MPKRKSIEIAEEKIQPLDAVAEGSKKAKFAPTDEFQQVSKAAFIDRYRIPGLGHGGEVFYQSDVSGFLY